MKVFPQTHWKCRQHDCCVNRNQGKSHAFTVVSRNKWLRFWPWKFFVLLSTFNADLLTTEFTRYWLKASVLWNRSQGILFISHIHRPFRGALLCMVMHCPGHVVSLSPRWSRPSFNGSCWVLCCIQSEKPAPAEGTIQPRMLHILTPAVFVEEMPRTLTVSACPYFQTFNGSGFSYGTCVG